MTVETSIWDRQAVSYFAIEDCCVCGVRFGMPKQMRLQRRRDQETFYCPNGHGQSYSESEAARLKRDLESAREDTAYWRAQYASEQNSLRTTKGHLTRFKNRARAAYSAALAAYSARDAAVRDARAQLDTARA